MTGSEPEGRGDPERSRFLATMSHDIRTPLTALRGALGLLERGDVPPEVHDQMIRMVRRSSIRFERLAFGLIAIDLIDAGSTPILREAADLREIVEDVVAATQREHELLDVDIPQERVDVACDRDRTGQALDHLIDNARKFGGPGSTVRVSVSADGSRGIVTVSDEGPGIAPEDRERIFQRYVQVGERMPNEPRGAGIGLYLARWNAEAMGGSVRLIDTAQSGSIFELSLPLLPAPKVDES